MNRSLALPVLALAATLVGAACSSSKSSPSFDPGLCARTSACFGSSLGGSFGETCQQLAGVLQEGALGGLGTEDQLIYSAVECIAGAADCAAMKACTQATPAEVTACGTSTGDMCSGEVLVQCGGTQSANNCAAAGAHCFSNAGVANCGTATCDTATAQPSCDGDLMVECKGGVLQSTSCAFWLEESCTGTGGTGDICTTTVGNTCGVVGGKAQCVGSGAACDPATTKAACDGTAIVSCTGGKTARFDCGQFGLGLTCQAMNDGTFTCGSASAACTSSTPESCNGSVLTYCWFGAVTTLDCKSYGLSGCTTTTNNGSTSASCTP